MFRINQAQHEHFRQRELAHFAVRALQRLRAALPEVWAEVDEDDGYYAVWCGIDLARAAGLEGDVQVLRFLELWSLVGGDDFGQRAEQRAAVVQLTQSVDDDDWLRLREILVASFTPAADLVAS